MTYKSVRELKEDNHTVYIRRIVSFSYLSDNPNAVSMPKMSGQRSDWRERLHANPSRMEQELAIKLQNGGIHYLTQVEIPVTTADFYFPLESKSLVVFVDGRVHLGTTQMAKDEELRTILCRRGYRVLELYYGSYSDNKRNELYQRIVGDLR